MIQNLNLVTAEKLNIPTACIEIDYDNGPRVSFKSVTEEWHTLEKNNNGEAVLVKDEEEGEKEEPTIDLIEFGADVWANPNYRGKLPSIPLLDESFCDRIKFRVSGHPSLINYIERLDGNMSEGKQVEMVIYEYIKTVLAPKLRSLQV